MDSSINCNFIGIGVQKSASTWVYRVLEDHPQVQVSTPKELNYFSYNYNEGDDWYNGHFLGAEERVTGEISPSYFHRDVVLDRIKKYNPDIKIIVTLRDPVGRAYSNHLHMIRVNQYLGEDLSFEKGMLAHEMYLDQSRYFLHLSKWFDLFPSENILVLIQENIEQNPFDEALKIYEFLGVDETHVSKFVNKRANVSYQAKSKLFEAMLKKFGCYARRLGLNAFVDYFKCLPLISIIRDKNKTHLSEVVPSLCPETEVALMNEFSEDVLKLTDLLGLNSLPWKTWEHANNNKTSKNSKHDFSKLDTHLN